MSRTICNDRFHKPFRLVAIVLAVGWGSCATTAEAARLHSRRVDLDDVRPPRPTKRSFNAFLHAGPALWSQATPRLPKGLKLALNPDGTPRPSLFLDLLRYRRSLAPARFDAHHPRIAPLLTLASVLPQFTANDLPQAAPPAVSPTFLRRPETLSVPEPSSIVVVGLVFTVVALGRRRRFLFSGDATAP